MSSSCRLYFLMLLPAAYGLTELGLFSKPCNPVGDGPAGQESAWQCLGHPNHFCSYQEVYGYHWCMHINILSISLPIFTCPGGISPVSFCQKNIFGLYHCPLKPDFEKRVLYTCYGQELLPQFGIVPYCCPYAFGDDKEANPVTNRIQNQII